MFNPYDFHINDLVMPKYNLWTKYPLLRGCYKIDSIDTDNQLIVGYQYGFKTEFHKSHLIKIPKIQDEIIIHKPNYTGSLWDDELFRDNQKLIVRSNAIDVHENLPSITARFPNDALDIWYYIDIFWLENFQINNESIDLQQFPHKCPRCNAAAYIGFNHVECTKCK
jgi:hypothetical protein